MYEAKLPMSSRVRLFGLPSVNSSYEDKTGVITAFNRAHNRYVVLLDDDLGTWRVKPRHLVPEFAKLSDLVNEAHGFNGIARAEVEQLANIHTSVRVFELIRALLTDPVREKKMIKDSNVSTQWTVASDVQLIVSSAIPSRPFTNSCTAYRARSTRNHSSTCGRAVRMQAIRFERRTLKRAAQ